jgi:sRNA-binding carbon storage regulator CsrA
MGKLALTLKPGEGITCRLSSALPAGTEINIELARFCGHPVNAARVAIEAPREVAIVRWNAGKREGAL